MPIEIEINESSKLVHSHAPAKVTDKDLLTHMSKIEEAFKRGQLDSSWRQIYDFSAVESVAGISTNVIHALATWVPIPWPAESLRVLVVPTDIAFALGYMYKTLGEPATNRLVIVSTLEEAMSCLEQDQSDRDNGSLPTDA